jgi:hypothetical protein
VQNVDVIRRFRERIGWAWSAVKMEDIHSESAVLSVAKRQIRGLQDTKKASASNPEADKDTEPRRRAVFAGV